MSDSTTKASETARADRAEIRVEDLKIDLKHAIAALILICSGLIAAVASYYSLQNKVDILQRDVSDIREILKFPPHAPTAHSETLPAGTASTPETSKPHSQANPQDGVIAKQAPLSQDAVNDPTAYANRR
jgi:hypothetical protein